MELKETILKIKKKYCVINLDEYDSENFILDKAGLALKNGADFIHIKSASAKSIYSLGVKIHELCSFFNALLIVEDRLDVAKLLSAEGVYLVEDSLSVEQALKILGDEILIGSHDRFGDYTLNQTSASDIPCFVPIQL